MQRGRPSGTATSLAPSSGTPVQPSSRAARAGYSAVRSGDDVKMALSTSSGRKPFASWSARNSSAGAHLGQDDPPLGALRPRLPPGVILGLSVGSREEAGRVAAGPADYWSVGPCFPTATKPDAGAPLGTAGFAALARRAPAGVPVIAIGGITAERAAALAAADAAGVAVTAAVFGASDPAAAARALRAAFDGPLESPPGARGR